MKYIPGLLLFVFICACQPSPEQENQKPDQPEAKYRLIHDDLYIDKVGNIYHRTDDVSQEDGKIRDAYRNYLRFDTVINGEQQYIDMDLKDVVDTASFHEQEVAASAKDIYRAFRDKNNDYYLKTMADGGTLTGKHRAATNPR